jgi:hypothetical protein
MARWSDPSASYFRAAIASLRRRTGALLRQAFSTSAVGLVALMPTAHLAPADLLGDAPPDRSTAIQSLRGGSTVRLTLPGRPDSDSAQAPQLENLELTATLSLVTPEGAPPTLHSFAVSATLGDYDGPPVLKPVANGDTLALSAKISLPASPTPLLSQVIWQIFNADGTPAGKFFESTDLWKTGSLHEARTKFPLKGLRDGDYSARLTHRLPQWSDLASVAEVPFSVFQFAAFDQLWVTNAPDNVSDKSTVLVGETPYFYTRYHVHPDAKNLLIKIEAHNQDGTVLADWKDQIDPGGGKFQRANVAIDRKSVRIGDTITFKALIAEPTGRTQTASRTIPVVGHPIAITLPSSLMSKEPGKFSIFVPPYFVPPLRINMGGAGLNISQDPSQPLTGTVAGMAEDADATFSFKVQVTDQEDRVGVADAILFVAPLPGSNTTVADIGHEQSDIDPVAEQPAATPAAPQVPASPVLAFNTDELPPEPVVSAPREPQDSAEPPAEAVATGPSGGVALDTDAATTALIEAKAAAIPETQTVERQPAKKVATITEATLASETRPDPVRFAAISKESQPSFSAPSPATRTPPLAPPTSSAIKSMSDEKATPGFEPQRCRQAFDQFRHAVVTRNGARSRMNDYHRDFIAKIRSLAAGQPSDRFQSFENLWSNLAGESDCSVFAFSVKDHKVARDAGYAATRVLKDCRLHSDARAAVLSGKFLLRDRNCLTEGGSLRAGILGPDTPKSSTPQTATASTSRR